MTRGFYNLTSGMLSQTRRLDVVANNMTNVSTSGYKSETYTDSTFGEVLLSRVGSTDKDNPQPVGEVSSMLAPSEFYINHEMGGMEETGLTLDFAINGDGYFAIQRDDGTIEYTKAGNFTLDAEGYLCLPGQGQVLDREGQPIQLTTDQIRADQFGRITTEAGVEMGQIGVYNFGDQEQLVKAESGLFLPNGQQANLVDTPILWGWQENSNVDLLQEMSNMLTAQRVLQSGAQVLKLYDALLTKTTTDVGRL